MITVQSSMHISLPKLDFTKQLLEASERIIAPDMRLGINRSIGVDNQPFPELEPGTIARKSGERKAARRSGGLTLAGVAGARGGSQQLVDTGKLRDAFEWAKVKTNHVRITIGNGRDKIGYYLQRDGVGKKKKKFHFFGISQRAEFQCISKMRQALGEALKKVNGS